MTGPDTLVESLMAGLPTNSWINPPPLSRTIGQKYPDREIVARRSKGPNQVSVAPRSKRPIRYFRPWSAQNG